MSEQAKDLGDGPYPKRFASAGHELVRVGGAHQNRRGLDYREFEEGDGLGALGSNAVLVEEGVVGAKGIENCAELDVDEHVVVASLVFGCLEEIRVVLDVLDDGEQSFDLAIFRAFG